MNQMKFILSLEPVHGLESDWWKKTKEILESPDARAVYEAPGLMPVKDVLASARVHLMTLGKAGVFALGLDELIAAMGSIEGSENVTCYGFASDDGGVIGNCYVDENFRVVGCYWLPLRK
ncbi:hypothetical protein [Janthinobacterium lividum]|uniref:hypothetical protein n=1 Tax=Janthinobacterium lividum TaxID=29581 RepID=UPI00111305EA|nr:hypothetical protein [Janthinobacterium lividum]MCC7716702.1 hypothetical protein [Janthinobacterium lividum]WQE31771.1 hypothetical protein U0004_29590 [Janthinobacterium lividum]